MIRDFLDLPRLPGFNRDAWSDGALARDLPEPRAPDWDWFLHNLAQNRDWEPGDRLFGRSNRRKISDLEPRSADGQGNNEEEVDFGSAGAELLRLAPAGFDGFGEVMAGDDRPNPREISNIVVRQTDPMPNENGLSDMFWVWGQFLDHDIDLTEGGTVEAAAIPVPVNDPYFDPFGTGDAAIGFFRADPMEGSGDTSVRAYENQITAFIDGSNIYGSSEEALELLRDEGGRLQIAADGLLLPDGVGGVLTGDIRAAENVALTSMHTLFVREHNWWADNLAGRFPRLSDDEIFDQARARVEAEMQAVTFNEFLPALLGEDVVPEYSGYDPAINPGIAVEFSTAAYRLGHTLLSPEIERRSEDGSVIAAGDLALRDAFFNVAEIEANGGIDPILRGVSEGMAQAYDPYMVEDVRSFLFGPPGAGGFDLASLNIQRGRDLGLPTYNEMRQALGLAPAEDFSDISSDAAAVASLEAAYGQVGLVDLWVGGVAEDPVNDGIVGETFAVILLDQFTRLRDGDRFWSQDGRFTAGEGAKLWSTSLSEIILRNTDIEYLQRDVFSAYDRIGGTANGDTLIGTSASDLLIGFDGDDFLSGGLAGDELFGGEGNDTLTGGPGDDIATGGAGHDTFIFDAADPGHDIITDFSAGDSLILNGLGGANASVSSVLGAGPQAQDITVTFSETQSITFEEVGWGDVGQILAAF